VPLRVWSDALVRPIRNLWLDAALSVALARVGENGAAQRELDAALAAGRNLTRWSLARWSLVQQLKPCS
jgi:hypothetical protein